jgi:hypothetical protein
MGYDFHVELRGFKYCILKAMRQRQFGAQNDLRRLAVIFAVLSVISDFGLGSG